jgi:hypothetical protein
VRTSNLREALASPLFTMIRENAHLLETAGHPCGLSAHAEELESMTKALGAYRAGAPDSAARDKEWLTGVRLFFRELLQPVACQHDAAICLGNDLKIKFVFRLHGSGETMVHEPRPHHFRATG